MGESASERQERRKDIESGGEIRERDSGERDRLKEKWEERSENVQHVSRAKEHPCSQDTANDRHTRQGAHRGTLHHGLPFKENTLPFFAAGFIQHTSTSSTFYLEREKDHHLTAIKKRAVFPDFSQLSGGQQGSLGQSTMVWTAKLLLCSGAGGLAVQPYMATK